MSFLFALPVSTFAEMVRGFAGVAATEAVTDVLLRRLGVTALFLAVCWLIVAWFGGFTLGSVVCVTVVLFTAAAALIWLSVVGAVWFS